MLISGIKSRPTYNTIEFDSTGRDHLLVASGSGWSVIERVCGEAPAALRSSVSILYWPDGQAAPSAPQGIHLTLAHEKLSLIGAVEVALAKARMGLRLYIAGPETMIWDVMQVADRFGMHKNEVAREIAGSLARRVFCTHCRNYDEGVTTSIHPCSKCGEPLLVRDHFSRRHAAFMGVKVDAEAPGEVPEAQEVFP